MSNVKVGPITNGEIPPFTEIVCVYVPKVFDFCFEQDVRVQCTPIPTTCGTVPVTADIECEVDEVFCQTGTPVPTGQDGFALLPVTVTVAATITIRVNNVVRCTFAATPVIINKTIVVCRPDPRVVCTCEATAACGDCLVQDNQVCCTFAVCVIVECDAPVKLLIPSFGFCVPTPCEVAGFPPGFECPPTDLFPPQCEPD